MWRWLLLSLVGLALSAAVQPDRAKLVLDHIRQNYQSSASISEPRLGPAYYMSRSSGSLTIYYVYRTDDQDRIIELAREARRKTSYKSISIEFRDEERFVQHGPNAKSRSGEKVLRRATVRD